MPWSDHLPSLPFLRELVEQRLRRLTHPARLGTLRRLRPISERWGYDRGTPIDRYYIERFLASHRDDVRGRLLEIRDRRYATRFGAPGSSIDVLDIDAQNPEATLVADLASADAIPSERFDCFLLTQTLQYIRDLPAALRHTHRILRPGGVVLAVVPCLQRADPAFLDGDYWRFTTASARSLFAEAFGDAQVSVSSYGNVLTAIGSLTGMASQELSPHELDTADASFPVIAGIRAVRA